jgi:tetratricopeptide (TPR) repeat protein
MSEEAPAPDPLEQAAESFLARLRAGEHPAVAEYEARYPDLAADIRETFPALALMEQGRRCVDPPPEPDPARLAEGQVPRRLGDYCLLREIGRGGMGVVYEAWQESLGRRVALKVLAYNNLARPDHLERFRREARAAARLHHTNIVPVFGVGEHAGVHYYAMQFIRGQGLDAVLHEVRRLRRQGQAPLGPPTVAATAARGLVSGQFARPAEVEEAGPDDTTVQPADPAGEKLPNPAPAAPAPSGRSSPSSLALHPERAYFASVARVGAQAAEALDYAHHQGVLHRDIKPANLLLDTAGQVWIADFGLAKEHDADVLTRSGDIVGTLRYMAPERFHGQADARSDVYGLGVTLYELVTLRPALEAGPGGTPLEQLINQDPPRPRKLDPLIPRDLETIVLKAMAREPERRYATAGELAEDLHRFLADRPVRARRTSWRERAWRWCRRNPAVAGLLTSVAVLILVIAGSVGWALGNEAARRAELASKLEQVVSGARTAFAENRLALARQKLAEAKGLVGEDRAELATLAADMKAIEAELECFQKFQDFVAEAHQAQMPDPLRQPAIAAPLFLKALDCYHILEREDWRTSLECCLLGKDQVEQVRRTVYEVLVWLADDLLRRRQDHQSKQALSREAAARQALAYLRRAEQGHPPTQVFYWLRAHCRKELGEQEAMRADQEWASRTPPTMALDHYLQGEEAFFKRNRAKGIKAFEAALRLEPSHYWSLMWLGYCLSDLGTGPEDYNAAAVAFTGCILKRPEYAHAHYCRGNAYFKSGRHEEAVADYSRAIDLGARLPDVWINRGNAYRELGRLEEAIADYSTTIRLDPKYAQAWCSRGSVYGNQGQWQKCLNDSSRAVELDRKQVYAWRNRSIAHEALGQWQGVVDDCTKALDLDPKDISTRARRAFAYVKLRQWREAIDDYSTVLERAPERTNAWIARGYAYSQLKQWERSRRDCSQAITLDDKNPLPWHNLAVAESNLGRWETTVSCFSKALALDRNHPGAQGRRAYAYAVLGEWKLAADDLSPGEMKGARLDDTWFQLACLRLLQGDTAGYHQLRKQLLWRITLTKSGFRGWVASLASRTCTVYPEGGTSAAEAVRWAEKAVESEPRSGGFRHVLALAQYRAKLFEKSVQSCRESMKLDPQWNGTVLNWLLLAMADHRLGQPQEASRHFQQVVQWREMAGRGSGKANAPSPPDMVLTDWLEFEVLYREAERLFQQPGKRTPRTERDD